MITINLTTRKLDVFDNFLIDRGLPKYKVKTKVDGPEDSKSSGFVTGRGRVFAMSGLGQWDREESQEESNRIKYSKFRLSLGYFKYKIEEFINNLLNKDFRPKKNVIKIFDIVFDKEEQLKEFTDKQNIFDKMIQDANDAGQVALVESLETERNLRIVENALISLGYDKFISESNMVDIALSSEKGLRLDWIKSFIRPLPIDVLEKKKSIDNNKIFDNYVILHYDPKNINNKLTKAEVEKKKDPILFGVIDGSTKLYFIADWIDEHCNLTFEELIKIKEKYNIPGETKLI